MNLTPKEAPSAEELVLISRISRTFNDKHNVQLLRAHVSAEVAAKNAKLNDELEWLQYLVNFVRLPLGIDPTVSNFNRRDIIAALDLAIRQVVEVARRMVELRKENDKYKEGDWQTASHLNAQASDNWRAEAAKLSAEAEELRKALNDASNFWQAVPMAYGENHLCHDAMAKSLAIRDAALSRSAATESKP